MTTHAKLLSVGLAAVLHVTVTDAAAGQTVDRTDAVATAHAVLSAYQARDLARLAPLVNGNNRELISELAQRGPDHPRYRSIFRGWRWEAIEGWGGEVGEVRYASRNEAMIAFGELGPNEVAVVVLTWENAAWAFEDVNSPSRADFESLATTRPAGR